MPHLSFLYSDCGRAEREALAAKLDARVRAVGHVRVARIEVWDTGAPLAHWRFVGAVPLGGG
jgi:hypothetical protein